MKFSRLSQLLELSVPFVAPAIVCRIEQAGEVLFERGYGWLNPMLKRQSTPVGTLFDLASVTKLFTVTACLRLIDIGKLELDQSVASVLPEFGGSRSLGESEDPITKDAIPLDPRWNGCENPSEIDASIVTIRHLLTHSGGLPAWRSIYRLNDPPPALPASIERAELLQRQTMGLNAIISYPFIYPPDADYAYSDIGLILLAAVITRTNGDATIAQTIRHFVTDPLQAEAHFTPSVLQRHRVAPTEYCRWRQRRLWGEVHDENAAGLGGVAGHAGLFGTAADVCTLGNLYLAMGRYRGEQLLASETVLASRAEHLCTAEGERRGLGWMLRSEPNPSCSMAFSKESFGHTGYTGTSLWCDPKRELAVALLTNRVYHGRAPEKIASLRTTVHEAIIAELDG